MKTNNKIIFIFLINLSVAACSDNSIEKEILQKTAIEDAKHASAQLKTAYLNCYALPEIEKNYCKEKAGRYHPRRLQASSWDYVLPFDYEAEKQGFITFLHDNGKVCNGLKESPIFNKEKNAYIVNCTDKQYLLGFSYKSGKWQVFK